MAVTFMLKIKNYGCLLDLISPFQKYKPVSNDIILESAKSNLQNYQVF